MNRSERREALRELRRGHPFARKLAAEALLLQALGLLDEAGSIHCGDCGEIVERSEGWRFDVTCSCGWRLVDVDEDADDAAA